MEGTVRPDFERLFYAFFKSKPLMGRTVAVELLYLPFVVPIYRDYSEMKRDEYSSSDVA